MAQTSRLSLYTEFDNGQRPSGLDFANFIDSCLNLLDDPLSFDSSGNCVFSNAIGVGNTLEDTLGSIRFDGSKFMFREISGWEELGSGGAFASVGGGSDVAFNDGKVGIDTGTTPTNFKFEVNLGVNDGEGNRVKLGNAAIHNSETSSSRAYFSHADHANNSEFAFLQYKNGNVQVNAPDTSSGLNIRFTLGGNKTFMAVTPANNTNGGVVVVGGTTPSVDLVNFNQVSLFVQGDAFKTQGGDTWETSDIRLKKNVTPFKNGLDILKKINPIRFRFNGKAWTEESNEKIGVSGQEIQEVASFMVTKTTMNKELNPDDNEEYLVVNSQPFIYLAINAIKELADKIENLEKQHQHA